MGLASAPLFSWASVLKKSPRTTAVLFLFSFVVAAAQYGCAQCDGCTAPAAAADVLGVHSDSGRGCAGCHIPHVPEAGGIALWGQNASPSYGPTVVLGDAENSVEMTPARGTSPAEDVGGILLCLSCHDGNLTPQNMMSSQSYARAVGVLRNPGRQPIPTLLADGGLAGNYSVDHPVGADATIALGGGLVFANGAFSVTPGSPYARFMANYGLPVLTPGKPFTAHGGVNGAGQPYLLCTTCHNQHQMASYSSTATTPIAGDGGGQTYSTYFFANGPYNPEFDTVPTPRAASTAQFCRQCHLSLANEGNNTLNIRTAFY